MKKLQRAMSVFALVLSLGVIVKAQGYPIPAIVNGGALDRRLVNYQQKVLTNAQVLALNSTPITLIPAQGAGTIIEPLGGILSYHYVGAYTGVSGHNLRMWYTSRVAGPAASPVITMLGFLDATADKVINFQGVPADEILSVNTPIVIQGVDGTAYGGGNALNTLTIRIAYRVHNK